MEDGGLGRRARVRGRRGGKQGTAGFGATLRTMRDARGLSQRDLAHRLDISASFLSLLEGGQRRPAREHIAAIAHALQLAPDEEQRLLAAAGFEVNDLGSAVERVVELIAEQTSLDDFDSRFVLADLNAIAQGWLDAVSNIRFLRAGKFSEAANAYDALIQHREYSPTLLAYLQNRRVDALLRLGELDTAKIITLQVAKTMNELPANWTPALRAEIVASEGLLALREGNYVTAKSKLEASKSQYAKLLPDASTAEDLVYQGFGRSYKRLAQLAMFQGDATEALSSCVAAEAYLARAPESQERELWLRRTRELKGWAYSQLGTHADIQKAVEIHEEAREASEAAGDIYGAIMGWLYIADDVRRGIQLTIDETPPLPEDRLTDLAARRDWLRAAVKPVAADIERAEDAYRAALQGIEAAHDQLMEGRCLSSLANLLRYRASLAETEADARPIYEQAQQCLDRALAIDKDMGQGRRVPDIYATVANLAWDQAAWDRNELTRAARHVELALTALDSPSITSSDASARRLRAKLHDDQDALRRIIEEVLAPSDRDREWRAGGDSRSIPLADKWRDVTAQLVERIQRSIGQRGIGPHSLSDKSEAWLDAILQVEKMPGTRVLAQNKFSVSLSLLLPAGSHAGCADLYRRRYNAFQDSVKQARTRGDNGANREGRVNRDLCHRATVEEALQTLSLYDMTIEQMRQVLTLMETDHPGYVLESCDHNLPALPLAFMVKNATVLVEAPVELAQRFAGSARLAGAQVGHAVCYLLSDPQLADDLTAIFEQLIDLARRSTSGMASTREWLQELASSAAPTTVGAAGNM